MAGKAVRVGSKCPYCNEGRLLEKPRSAFEDEFDEYSDPYTEMRMAKIQNRSLLCRSCGSEIRSRDWEVLEMALLA